MAKLDYSGLTEGICRAFQRINFTTKIFDTKKYRKIDKYLKMNLSFKRFEDCLQEFSPDIVFVVAPLFLKPEYFDILDKYKSKNKFLAIGWIGDSFIFTDENEKKIEILDKVYYTDTGFFDVFNGEKTEYLPLATDPLVFTKRSFAQVHDCSFVASMTQGRRQFLCMSRQPINIFGPGWERKDFKSSCHKVKRCKLKLAQVASIYTRSKMVLNLKNENNVINGLNQRSFDPFSSGSMLLHDYVSDLELNFDVGKEIVAFKDGDEFFYLYEKYIKDRRLREEIADAGRKRVVSSHTYDNRVFKIISEI
ncbi:glycosyltransferase [Geoalkalibacter halelectricus]|uniref:Glycosyltransferase n=1 Tax=Geoalkalibacter halelectricus TaxID=2847045 RepID=A0ABY5ZGE3_9BACT|nr:glycosyltransferase [Geoalkalibacter halelectricus]MDO3379579.1 glycosyltransferase [Geoalkalibacter halelectricus]UWZ78166.1 glycosyltransferase [Geoalkalibacter halelectricus]